MTPLARVTVSLYASCAQRSSMKGYELVVPINAVRALVFVSGIVHIFTSFLIVWTFHSVVVELGLLILGMLLIVGSVGFSGYESDSEIDEEVE